MRSYLFFSASSLKQEFKGEISKYSPTVKENLTLAAKDAQNRAQKMEDFVMASIPGAGGVRPSFHVSKEGVTRISEDKPQNSLQKIPAGDAGDFLKALDVNGDGVIDKTDIEILRSKN